MYVCMYVCVLYVRMYIGTYVNIITMHQSLFNLKYDYLTIPNLVSLLISQPSRHTDFPMDKKQGQIGRSGTKQAAATRFSRVLRRPSCLQKSGKKV